MAFLSQLYFVHSHDLSIIDTHTPTVSSVDTALSLPLRGLWRCVSCMAIADSAIIAVRPGVRCPRVCARFVALLTFLRLVRARAARQAVAPGPRAGETGCVLLNKLW